MRRAFLTGLLTAVALTALGGSLRAQVDPEVLRAEAERVAVLAKARQTAVAIFGATGDGGGSGVLISADGYALTNFHVVRGSGPALRCGLSDGRAYDAVLVGLDPVGDVALIKLFGRSDFPHAVMADSDRVRVGDWVYAVGNPFLLATDFQPTVTYGIVSGVHRYQYPAGTLLEYADCIQTDASINPGNSGGPLFNARGELIGINGRGSFEKRGRVNVGVGYAITINQIRHFLGALRGGLIVDHATLGAVVRTDDEGRVVVDDLLESSDAFRRGVSFGDEILRFGGRPIGTVNAFKNVLGIFPKGWRVPLVYRREGQTFETYVRLSGVHSTDELLRKMFGPGEEEPPPAPQPPEEPAPGGPREPPPAPAPGPEQKRPPAPGPQPRRLPIPGHPRVEGVEPPPLPEIVARHYAERRGYANYYFNRLERDRVWSRFASRGGGQAAVDTWMAVGQQAGLGDAEFTIGPTRVDCKLLGGEAAIELNDNLAEAFDPPGSGGLLAALGLWRRLQVLGPDKYGDVTYLGQAPWPGRSEWFDVLSARHGGVELRVYFAAADGQPAALELFLAEDVDPCEIEFSEYRETAGRWLPGRLLVRYGASVFGDFRIREWSLGEQVVP